MNALFSLISTLLEIYSIICVIRIFMTWIPSLSYSRAGSYLSKICDPYLNLFRHKRFLVFGGLDFSPAFALIILSALTSFFRALAYTGSFNIFILLGIFINLIENFILSIISFFIIILIIRFIMDFFIQNSYGSPVTNALDRFLSPIVYKIAKTFTLGKSISFRNALLISTITLVLVSIGLVFLFGILNDMITKSVLAIDSLINRTGAE